MDILQTALVFMVFIVCVLLIVFGVMVFLILREMKKGMDRMNNILESGEGMMVEMGKPMVLTMKLLGILGIGTKAASMISSFISNFVGKTSKNSTSKIREVK